MQHEWLTQNQHTQLIVFFNGWGMDKTSISHLQDKNNTFDCLHFFDYQSMNISDFNCSDKFNRYEKIYLIAWSMGVFISSCLPLHYTKKIAFCGTGNPIDSKEGIPPKVYRLTVQNFTDKTKQLFSEKINFSINNSRDTASLQNELASISNYNLPKDLHFDTAFIANKDEIFPPANQITYWQNHAEQIHFLDSKHYAFDLFSSWQEILNF